MGWKTFSTFNKFAKAFCIKKALIKFRRMDYMDRFNSENICPPELLKSRVNRTAFAYNQIIDLIACYT